MNDIKNRATPARDLDLNGVRLAIVSSRFNESIVERLVDGAMRTLQAYGIGTGDIAILQVPGAFELPLAARTLAEAGNHDGIIALGAVIRGETEHFDYVCSECASGLMKVSLDYGLPVGFGVLTVATADQAWARAGEVDNKGEEATQAVLEMVHLLRRTGT